MSNVNLNVTIDIDEDDATNAAPLVNQKLNITIDKNNIQETIQPTVLNNDFAPIPNSFDMFADDLNKQSGLNSPTSSSSASSSTSSLTSNKMYYNRGSLPVNSKLANYKNSVKILTSSIDKDLNKIVTKEEPSKSPVPSQVKSKQSRVSTYGHPPQARSSIPTGLPKPTQVASSQVLRNATNNNSNVKVINAFLSLLFFLIRLKAIINQKTFLVQEKSWSLYFKTE